jgi:hypothetical protein
MRRDVTTADGVSTAATLVAAPATAVAAATTPALGKREVRNHQ